MVRDLIKTSRSSMAATATRAADSCRPHAETHSAASLPKISRIGDFDPSGMHMSEVDCRSVSSAMAASSISPGLPFCATIATGSPSFDGDNGSVKTVPGWRK